MGLRSHPSGLLVPETPSTSFLFVRSDRPVYATASIRPSGPCQPSMALAGHTFSYLRNPSPHVPCRVHDFYGRLHAGDSQISGTWTHTDRKLHISCLELKVVSHALQHWAQMLQGHQVMIATDNSTVVFVYQQTRRDTFPHLVAVDSRASPLVRGSEHNSPSKTYPRLSERDSRPPITSKPANTDRVVPTPRDREAYLQGLGDTRSRQVCNTVELPPSLVHFSNSGAKSPSGGCSVSGLAGEVNVHVSPIPLAQQSHAEASVHSGGGGNSRIPLVAVSAVFSTSATSLCGTPSSSPLPWRSSVPAGSEVHLRRKVVPSARMEALMRHYKAAGF